MMWLKCYLFPDVNECDNSPCVNGVCQNTAGSFTCDCTGTNFNGDLCQNGEFKDNLKLQKHIVRISFLVAFFLHSRSPNKDILVSKRHVLLQYKWFQ